MTRLPRTAVNQPSAAASICHRSTAYVLLEPFAMSSVSGPVLRARAASWPSWFGNALQQPSGGWLQVRRRTSTPAARSLSAVYSLSAGSNSGSNRSMGSTSTSVGGSASASAPRLAGGTRLGAVRRPRSSGAKPGRSRDVSLMTDVSTASNMESVASAIPSRRWTAREMAFADATCEAPVVNRSGAAPRSQEPKTWTTPPTSGHSLCSGRCTSGFRRDGYMPRDRRPLGLGSFTASYRACSRRV
jgi:hypothetical protein